MKGLLVARFRHCVIRATIRESSFDERSEPKGCVPFSVTYSGISVPKRIFAILLFPHIISIDYAQSRAGYTSSCNHEKTRINTPCIARIDLDSLIIACSMLSLL